LIKIELIDKIIDAVYLYGAAIPLLPLIETPKEGDFSGPGGTGFITRHLKRAGLGVAQTPQGFVFPEILRAHEKAAIRESRDGVEYTDDAEVWGEFVGPVAVVSGDPENRKITFPGDMRVD
jgi:2-C-methyl-D-erythritol 4-phosphate cytidylyltransferase